VNAWCSPAAKRRDRQLSRRKDNRRDFNIVYPGMPDDLIKDDVTIKLTLRAPRS